jgi:hypothetical protein
MRNRIADELNNADLQASASTAIKVLNGLQDSRPGEQVIGACATFLLLCEHYGVPAQDAFTVTKNAMNDADRRLVPEFGAVRLYVENELP